ncbi:MAG: DoxX family membrane protein, partial [Candidatus Glassbacteria bacterium]
RDGQTNGGMTKLQTWGLVVLRLAIGWHFLYEGLVKITNPDWTCAAYLADSKWIFRGLFDWILMNPPVLRAVDLLNMWGLALIGLGLVFGVLVRTAAVSGIALLALYWVANPPLVESVKSMFTEGNYLLVDKNLVEMLALVVVAILPGSSRFRLDSLLALGARKEKAAPPREASLPADSSAAGVPLGPISRREILRPLIGLPVFGGFVWAALKRAGWQSFEEKSLLEASMQNNPEALTSATIKTFRFASLSELKGTLPYGHIKGLKLSRMVLGGNLIGGWAHARDLIYVSELVKAYHSDQKVFDTFRMAEKCGVNTIITNPALGRVINDYWRKERGSIQFISDSAYGKDLITGIQLSIDGGACACYVQGGIADRLYRDGKVEEIARGVEFIRQNGLPAGVGAHMLDTVKACVDLGIQPDFWVKTLHHTDYWSATPTDEHDNIWCTDPDETVAYMETLPQPWIAYKILAAGAIEPKWASLTPSRAARTLSAWACTTSRSWMTSTWRSRCLTATCSAPGPGAIPRLS